MGRSIRILCWIIGSMVLSAGAAFACTSTSCDVNGWDAHTQRTCKQICTRWGYLWWNYEAVNRCDLNPKGTCYAWHRTEPAHNLYVNCQTTYIGSFSLDDFIHNGVGGQCDDGEGNLTASIEVQGNQYAQCINKGGNVAPGRREVKIETAQTLDSTGCAQGKFHFDAEVGDKAAFTLTEVPISSSPKDLGCANGNWNLVRDSAGQVVTAKDEGGNPYTVWKSMNIHIVPERGHERVSRACCTTTLEDVDPKTCTHAYCRQAGVPDAAPDGTRIGELSCGIVWTSDQACRAEGTFDADGNLTGFGPATSCPAGSTCGADGKCQTMQCVPGVTTCPMASTCEDGLCVPDCSI